MLDRRHLLLALAGVLAPSATIAAAPKKEKKKGGGPSFVQFSTLTATIMRPDGRRGVLTVEAGVDVPDEALRERVALLTPRLRDAYSRVVRTAAVSLRPGWPPDVERLAQDLQKATDATVGKPGARFMIGVVMVN
jgi:flagellar basal body-associated protein FliL